MRADQHRARRERIERGWAFQLRVRERVRESERGREREREIEREREREREKERERTRLGLSTAGERSCCIVCMDGLYCLGTPSLY